MTGRLLLVALLAASPLQALDDAVRADVQAHRRPWLEAPMRIATEASRPALAAGFAVALLAGPAGRALALEMAVALVPLNAVVELTKYATNRARPDGTRRRSNAAYPSSHAANAFAVATVLARRWRRSWPLAFGLATVVAASRVYLNRHWLTDVASGAALGVAMGYWCVAAWRHVRARRGAAPPAAPA